MTTRLDNLTWPESRLGEALEAVARTGRLKPRQVDVPPPPQGVSSSNGHGLNSWIAEAAARLGVEAEEVESPYGTVHRFITGVGPALFRLPHNGRARFLAITGCDERQATVIPPDGDACQVDAAAVESAVCRSLEDMLAEPVDRLLAEAGVPANRRKRAQEAILRERLGRLPVSGCWLLRPQPGSSFWGQFKEARLPRFLALMLGSHAVHHTLMILSWWVIGRGALQGRLDAGWLLAWVLLVFTMIGPRLVTIWCQGRLSFGAGALLRQRLLAGAFRLDPQRTRREGVGHLLGRVMESEAVEALVLGGGFLALVAAVEVVGAAIVLLIGPAGGVHGLLYAGWLLVVGLAIRRFYVQRRHWTQTRVGLTHDLVERMVGHRTRLAQESPDRWHDGEDEPLQHYYEQSTAMDRIAAIVLSGAVGGWTIVGLCGLLPALLREDPSATAMAVGIGGILLGARALEKLSNGFSYLLDARIAWDQVSPLFHAAADAERPGSPEYLVSGPEGAGDKTGGKDAAPLMEAHDVEFRYRDSGPAVLRGCHLSVCHRDRLLLEGPSGCGKSTLASVLFGLREPQSGLLLLDGLDRDSLGDRGWRRKVVAAPQFHENLIFTGSLAFNLLMGRGWPADDEDLIEAERICRELGLGDVLDRMPAGLQQMVGETGWQLSHGEKSRIYVARALLQEADLIILDESFAALDPETLRRCLQCVLSRARALLVIAHP
jgi:ATP-binding cassette subfamily B protein